MANALGLWMLGLLALLIVLTGLPVWALLIGVASAFAAGGVISGAFSASVLAAMPSRLLGLLEHDLLQALPLYALIGVLLQRLLLAKVIAGTLARALAITGAGPALAALGMGALLAPMNGSVASSSATLSSAIAEQLQHVPPARAVALLGACATIGVVFPPSLVLILLGDAMLRAHTEASNSHNLALQGQRILNTQDVFHAALLPALMVLVLWSLVTWWQGRLQEEKRAVEHIEPAHIAITLIVIAVLLMLLGAIFSGRMFAVEAAATGAVLLCVGAVASRALRPADWSQVFAQTLALSGALFALLLGASTFSLVFRLWGTDVWFAQQVMASPLPPMATAALVLIAVALCAWVLDAFEMIFVVVPIVAPLLIVQTGDAAQVAVLLLLVLQTSFLIPPMGYAVLMARAQAPWREVDTQRVMVALAPYVLAQCAVIALVFAAPRWVHLLDNAPDATTRNDVPSDAEITLQLQNMVPPQREDDTQSDAVSSAPAPNISEAASAAKPR